MGESEGSSGPEVAVRPGGGRSKYALANWRVRWRVVAMVAIPTLTAAFLGAFSIYSDANGWLANGRVRNLAHLNVSVVRLTQTLEDERDLSAGYAVNPAADLGSKLRLAQATAASATRTVRAGATGITTAAGYQATVVEDLDTLLSSVGQLQVVRQKMFSAPTSAAKTVQTYTDRAIQAADTFSVSVGNGTSDADLNGDVTALGALARVENQMSLQRAGLFVALSSSPPALTPAQLTSLLQAQQQQAADQAEFTAAASQAELQRFNATVNGAAVEQTRAQEALALTNAFSNQPLTALNAESSTKLTASGWYQASTLTIDDTRQVTGQLAAGIATRADTLRSRATTGLLFSSLLTVALLGVVLLVSTLVAQSLTRPLRKLRSEALDVAGHRLPDMMRRLDGTGEATDIEPIGITSTEEIGEVARAFDQVYREAVRLAADEAKLRGNMSAMFINLSRRSQTLVEGQLSLIESLEQSEEDAGRLSSLFRLDHLATRMRRNSENLLVLAGHEVTRRWSQPIPLVDVLRAAISEIEQYERVVLTAQPGIVVAGHAVSDVVHLVAELVENATTYSPEDTQVHVSGHTLSSGGVLVEITDSGVGISDQEMSHANWRLDNPPVVDVAVSRRMGLFVVGRLAARHGIRVRLRHARPGGLTALIWLPETVATPEVPPDQVRRFQAEQYAPAVSLAAPIVPAPSVVPEPVGSFGPVGASGPVSAFGPAGAFWSVSLGEQIPAGGQEGRLPIFDSVESDWFRRGGTTHGSATPAQGQGSWNSPGDEGWRAAQVVAAPKAPDTTRAGLPQRVPLANLVPGSVGGDAVAGQNPAGQNAAGQSDVPEGAADASGRSADAARSRMTSFQRGVRDGRAVTPPAEER